MKKIFFSALMLATAATASAQVLINPDGKMHIGDRLPYNNSLKGFNGQLSGTTGTQALAVGGIIGPGISYPDSVSADSDATLALLGTAANNAGAYISFGDFSYVGVGEYGGYDSDILGLYGSSGIIYSYNANKLTDSTRGQVFYWKPSPNYSAPFVFNVDLKVNGVAIASDMRLKEDVEEIEDASASLADITPVTYRLTERAAAEQASKASAVSEGDAGV